MLVLVAWGVNYALRDPVDLSIEASGARVFPLDALAALLAATAVVRVVWQRKVDLGRGLAFVMLALVAVYGIRGVLSFDVETGANAARTWFYFAAALAFAATSSAAANRRCLKLIISAGFALAVAAIPYFIADGIHSSSFEIEQDGGMINWRPIVATGALVILQAAILAVALRWPRPKLAWGFAAFAIVIVVLLQHRTIWLAAGAVLAVAAVYLIATNDASRARRLAAASGLVAIAVAVPIALVASGEADALIDSATSGDTAAWRTDGWEQLITNNDSASEIAIGNPAGEGFERVDRGVTISFSAHNEFVDAFVRFGLPGVIVIVALLILAFVRRRQAGAALGISPLAVALLLLTQLVFCFSYSLDVVQGLLLGALVAPFAATRVDDPGPIDGG